MLIKDISIGSKVFLGTIGGDDIIWRKVSDRSDFISDNKVRSAEYDAQEYRGTNRSRRSNGNNFFPQSNICQWLNSTGDDWFKPKHEFDTVPTYIHEPGFLSCFSPAEREMLSYRKINILVPYGSKKEFGRLTTLNCRVCLPSASEVGNNGEDFPEEGEFLPETLNCDEGVRYGPMIMTRTGVHDGGHILVKCYGSWAEYSACQQVAVHPMIRIKQSAEVFEYIKGSGIYCLSVSDTMDMDEYFNLISI